MMFAADRMLGRLAKWLRILGYDSVYCNTLSDDRFLALADQGRILLTRNTRLVGKVPPDRLVFIEANNPRAQLRELIGILGLRPNPNKFFSRCTICNGTLMPAKPEDVVGEVPEHVWIAHHRFSRCKTCKKIYWPGSHHMRSRQEIRRALGV
ncbi:MAG: Mut7-C RNAse domain-containing protein [Deltaproteobacteria bacterium]|nr:Mut7-C RNAse domain-containing protein [Deltaproteobacteria bacterium]MBW2018434.1 Mut7-C RNAse domain-containing protein [Deltaproteobacteria bacterium]MBW2073721.1 Mut7-C RNAse domain-containing protein [Deltaproteobacteria bacterium]